MNGADIRFKIESPGMSCTQLQVPEEVFMKLHLIATHLGGDPEAMLHSIAT